jgi:hypothetical protein
LKVFNRVCIKDYTVTDQEGTSFTVERARSYITSPEKDGTVMVFSRYWITVPVEIFAGEREGVR